MWVCFAGETQHFDESLLGMWVCVCVCVCVFEVVCLCFGGNEGVQGLYISACVHSLPHPWRVVWGILCRFLLGGGRWVLGVFHSDVISPDNGLVKAGILRAPSLFDCVGQLWRNGHYLPVSGSIKKHPPASPPASPPVTPALEFPQGEGHRPVTLWPGESESNHQTFTHINGFTLHLNHSFWD